MAVAVLPLVVRIAARRPASWLAAAIAAVAGLALVPANATAATIAAAIACGGWAAVAAAGHVPRGFVPGRAAVDGAIRWTRALWPLAGVAFATAVGGIGVGGVAVAGLILGVFIATAAGAAAARRHAVAADATTFAAVTSTAAAAAALVAGGAWIAVVVAGAVAAAILAIAWGAWRLGIGLPGPADAEPRSARPLLAEVGLVRGGLRRILVAFAMASSLAGLAGWYFLVPEAAAWGCPFAVGWFAALAVPVALIGPSTDAAWQGVAATAAAPGRGLPAAWRRPTGLRLAVAAAVGHAALLGWPPLVAGLLQTAESAVGPVAGPVWPWIAVAALAAAAACLSGLACLAAVVPLERDTALAAAAGLVAAAALLVVAELPGSPIAPG